MNSDKIMIGLQHVMARDSNHEFQFADGAGSVVKVWPGLPTLLTLVPNKGLPLSHFTLCPLLWCFRRELWGHVSTLVFYREQLGPTRQTYHDDLLLANLSLRPSQIPQNLGRTIPSTRHSEICLGKGYASLHSMNPVWRFLTTHSLFW